MPKKYTLTWHDEETGDHVQTVEYHESFGSSPPCPKCGKKTHYWEGQIDQDFMGNDIQGWNYVCYECRIGTKAEELDDEYDG